MMVFPPFPRHPLPPSPPRCELVFPKEFDDTQRQKANELLAVTGEHAQAILDVLQAAIKAGGDTQVQHGGTGRAG